ncbi:MAG: hypothetical protein M1831_001010 [Alyxoria varia]|nr:MAG: hypothetical protein M1831_001010 [Alyxoria varia]
MARSARREEHISSTGPGLAAAQLLAIWCDARGLNEGLVRGGPQLASQARRGTRFAVGVVGDQRGAGHKRQNGGVDTLSRHALNAAAQVNVHQRSAYLQASLFVKDAKGLGQSTKMSNSEPNDYGVSASSNPLNLPYDAFHDDGAAYQHEPIGTVYSSTSRHSTTLAALAALSGDPQIDFPMPGAWPTDDDQHTEPAPSSSSSSSSISPGPFTTIDEGENNEENDDNDELWDAEETIGGAVRPMNVFLVPDGPVPAPPRRRSTRTVEPGDLRFQILRRIAASNPDSFAGRFRANRVYNASANQSAAVPSANDHPAAHYLLFDDCNDNGNGNGNAVDDEGEGGIDGVPVVEDTSDDYDGTQRLVTPDRFPTPPGFVAGRRGDAE